MKDRIGETLIELRKKHNYTQNEIAEKLQVTYQAVSKWERDENLPDIFTLNKIANIYEITIDDLLQNRLREQSTTSHFRLTMMNILKTIAIFLMAISPVPYFFRNIGDPIGGILGSVITFIIGLFILVFIYFQRKTVQ
jgi:transcriptional regulator with XRE-family HTH domain